MKMNKGFTLLEVLIALIVISLVFFGCLSSISEMTKNSEKLKEETIGSIIASNIITQYRLGMINPTHSVELHDKVNMVNQTWMWSLNETSLPKLHIGVITVSIKNAQGQNVYTMMSYVSEKK